MPLVAPVAQLVEEMIEESLVNSGRFVETNGVAQSRFDFPFGCNFRHHAKLAVGGVGLGQRAKRSLRRVGHEK